VTALVRRLAAYDWATLRSVRLVALADAPLAFNSTHADEVMLEATAWRARLEEQAWFVAFKDERPVGIVSGGRLREHRPEARTLRSMWVDEARRGTGVANDLVDAVASWARDEGATQLMLWAIGRTGRAHAFYQRCGFVPTDEVREVDGRQHELMTRYLLQL
jgi:GNAT superfamily N-acetyltransferase